MSCMLSSKPEPFVPGMFLINGDSVTLDDGREFVATQHHQLWSLHDVPNHPYYREKESGQ